MKKRYFYWALLLASLSQADETIYTWRGGTSSAWENEDNWHHNDSDSTGFGAPDLWSADITDCEDGSLVTVDSTSLNRTINITSGTADIPQLFVDAENAEDADATRLQLDGFAFNSMGTAAHVINLGTNTTMENQLLLNSSGVGQTLNIAAGSEYDVVDMGYREEGINGIITLNMMINNAGTFRVADPGGTHEGNTFTNTATSTGARGALVLDSESTSTTYTDNTVINDGGATWVGRNHNISTNTIWNKVSGGGVPGYTVFQGGGNAVSFGGDSALQFNVNPTTSGFSVLKDNATLTGTGSNLTLHINTALDYNDVTQTLIYKNGSTGGSITGEFTVTLKNQDGDTVTDADFTMDYTTGTATTAPVGISKPTTIDGDAIGATLIPVLRVNFSRLSTGITEKTRRTVSSISHTAGHTLEKVRTAVHKLFVVAADTARQGNWSQSWGGVESNFGGGALKGKFKNDMFKAPSLASDNFAMTDGMFEMIGRENLERLSPLRTERTSVWVQPFGQIVSQAHRNNNASYDTKTAGIVFGCDHKVSQNLVVGGGLGTAHSTSEIRDGTKGKITDRFATVFASWTEDNWYVDAVLSTAINKYGNSRKVNTTTVASSSHDGYQVTPSLGLGYRLDQYKGWQIVPSLGTTLIYTSEKGYTERGASTNNQQVKGRCASQLRTEAGLNFSRAIVDESSKSKYSIFVKGILSNPIKKGHINGAIGGNSFNIQPGDRSEVYLGMGGSAEYKLTGHWFVNVHYANELGAGLAAHEVAIRIGKPL